MPQRGLEDRQLAARVRRSSAAPTHAQRPGVVAAAAAAARAAAGSGSARVVGLDARHRQQLGDHRLVLVGALAQVDRGQVEAEHLHRADQRLQPRADQRLRSGAACSEALDDAQVGQEVLAALA